MIAPPISTHTVRAAVERQSLVERTYELLKVRLAVWTRSYSELAFKYKAAAGGFELAIDNAASRSGSSFGCILREFLGQGLAGELFAAYLDRVHGVRVDVFPGGLFIDEKQLNEECAAAALLHGLEAGIAALAAGRSDLLLGRGGHTDDNALLHGQVNQFADNGWSQDELADCVVDFWAIPAFAGGLIDIDPSLTLCELDELEEIASRVASSLAPFVVSRRRMQTPAGMTELRAIYASGSAPKRSGATIYASGSRMAARTVSPVAVHTQPTFDGTRCAMFAALALVDQLFAPAMPDGAYPVPSVAGSTPPNLTLWIEAFYKRCHAYTANCSGPAAPVILLMPDHTPAEVLANAGAVVVDLLQTASVKTRATLQAASVTFVDGVRLGFAAGAHDLGPTVAEALLNEIAKSGGDSFDIPEDFIALAAMYGLHVRPFNLTSAFDGYRAEAAMPALPAVLDVHDNVCERVFSETNLASTSSIFDPLSGGSMTYRELHAAAAAYARALGKLGLRPGDVVALAARDGLPAVALMLACAASGVIFAPLNYEASPAHLRTVLEAVGPCCVFIWEETPQADVLLQHRLIDLSRLDIGDDPKAPLAVLVRDGRASLVMLSTSGSTGVPKVLTHSHGDFLNCHVNYGRAVCRLQASDCVYTPSRMFFAYGLNNLMLSLLSGATHVLAAPLGSPHRILQAVEDYAVTVLFAVPAVFKMLLASRDATAPDLRLLVSAGETLPPKLHRRLSASFGVDVLDGIGCTEVLSTFISCRPSHSAPACTGTIVPGFSVRLVNATGEVCRIGELGSLYVRGTTVTPGYIGEAALNAQLFAKGWFQTQDLFFVDALGRFHYVGRSGSTIKINGCWVSLDAIDSVLQSHPAVQDCATCLIEDEFELPRPVALVVPASLSRPDPAGDTGSLWEELRALSRARLGRYSYPHAFAYATSLPRTSSGKLMRGALADEWRRANGASGTAAGCAVR